MRKNKCKICGEPLLEHNYRVTLFKYGVNPKTIHEHTEYTNHVDVRDGFLWMTDSNVTTAVNLDRVNTFVITDLQEDEK